MRLAFIVSHPIQYYVPVYRELERRIRLTADGIRLGESSGSEREPTGRRGTGIRGQGTGGGRQGTGDRRQGTGIRGQGTDEKRNSREKAQEAEGGKVQKYEGEKVEGADDGQRTTDDSARISAVKVFYTWRDAGPARDVRFGKTFAWDIPLMEGYDFEVVPNTSADPGTHHRQGLINPELVERVKAWKPDAVHITGYNYVSHGQAIKELSKVGIPVIFRGDSHLLDDRGPWWKWWIKKSWLSKVYRWPQGFAYVGQANRDYYRAFGVPERKLFPVPHTIEVGRFAEPHEELEAKALAWRRELGIPDDHFVFLYAAKLEPRKRPMELLEAFLAADIPKTTLLFVGSGELENALKERVFKGRQGTGDRGQTEEGPRRGAKGGGDEVGPRRQETGNGSQEPLEDAKARGNVLFLEFQNQSTMPVVYRLGDALVLPSGYGETWGLAVNEAQACGRPSLVSDCVGCARDIIREGENGSVFRTDDWEDCVAKMKRMVDEWRKETKRLPEGGDRIPETGGGSPRRPRANEESSVESRREAIRAGAWEFDTACGVEALLAGLAAASEGTGGRSQEPGPPA